MMAMVGMTMAKNKRKSVAMRIFVEEGEPNLPNCSVFISFA
jgi:hypothetical protein